MAVDPQRRARCGRFGARGERWRNHQRMLGFSGRARDGRWNDAIDPEALTQVNVGSASGCR